MRAIDRHEDAILDVLARTDRGEDLNEALGFVALHNDLSVTRLFSLLRTWCAIGGLEVPS